MKQPAEFTARFGITIVTSPLKMTDCRRSVRRVTVFGRKFEMPERCARVGISDAASMLEERSLARDVAMQPTDL
jgi:hypothetical protein